MEEKRPHLALKDAAEKARRYCVYQERCHQELRDKLYEWGLRGTDVEQVIAQMIEENFLNEERFARAFAGGKFRVKQWGRIKIRLELKRRHVSEYCIRQAMLEISDADYEATLAHELEKKLKTVKGLHPSIRNKKAATYLLSKGFEPELVWEAIRGYQT